ncbi:GNAT family N-acetyltransferase [Mariniflexile ostreae]|uniref:GNAT family N-acetyltransferase n=1 Tax=Mariniflexile ostreae TaxID=1520892 RepID=A0ABV5FDS6_9FLAO
MKIEKSHFLNALLEDHTVPPLYKTLTYGFNGALFYQNTASKLSPKDKNIGLQVHIAFPKFLKPEIHGETQGVDFKTIEQHQQDCFGIVIAPEITDINQYLNAHFNKNSRTPIIKKMKRLEHCFHIHYKVFYGDITQKNYTYLMALAHGMLLRRFQQRQDDNFILRDWEKYHSILYPLILEKKASLFVIYNGTEPIQISINFHFGKTFFAYIPAYNIDYAQFGLGNTAVYKQLEWCIANHYVYLDMGNGDLEYKKRWCNYHYVLETHIFYRTKNIRSRLSANKAFYKIKLKNIVKDVLKSELYNKIKLKFPINRPNISHLKTESYTIKNITSIQDFKPDVLLEIDFKNHCDYPQIINKPIYDFLYKTQEHLDNIIVYKIKNQNNCIIIKGKTKAIHLCFDSSISL